MQHGGDIWDVLVHLLCVLIGEAVGWGGPIGCASAAVDSPPLAVLSLPPPPPMQHGGDIWDVLAHLLCVLIGEAVGWGGPIGCASALAAVDSPRWL